MAVGKTDEWWTGEIEEVVDCAELLWISLSDFIVFSYSYPKSTSISDS